MATYYVDTAGDDGTGDGSSGNPWATLAHAIDNSIADDTIIMNAGTHTWVSDTIPQRTIQGIQAGVGGSNTSILDAAAAAVVWIINPTATINDITFRNATGVQNVGTFRFNTTAASVTFTRCIFHNIENDTSAINLGGGVFNTVGFGGFTGLSWTFVSCGFYDLRKTTGAVAGQLIGGHQTTIDPRGTITMTNCTLDFSGTGDAQWSRFISYGGRKYHPITLTNCIFNNRSGASIWMNQSGNEDIVSTNCCYSDDWDKTRVAETNSVNGDPLLIDPNNGDLRLQQDSPCIDAGTIV